MIILIQLILLFGHHCAIQINSDAAHHIFDHSGTYFTNLKAFISKLLLAIKIDLLYDGLASR